MYQEFYGLKEKPFEVTPDTKYLYLTPNHKELLASILYGIHERRGFIAVVGEVGTGKTMILNAVIDRLNSDVKTAYIYNSDLTAKQMLLMILFELGVTAVSKSMTKVEALQRLHDYALDVYRQNGNIAVIIDEAHLLAHGTMENLRMLSNLETKKEKLIQFILAGQPELDEKLILPEWRQLVQRISMKRYSTQFNEDNTYNYIKHRLETAGKNNGHIFTGQALKSVFEYSKGIPRLINIMCDNAMLIGYGMGKKSIDQNIIAEVVKDFSYSPLADTIDGTMKKGPQANPGEQAKIKSSEAPNEVAETDKDVAPNDSAISTPAVKSDPKTKNNMWVLKILSLLLICLAVFFFINR